MQRPKKENFSVFIFSFCKLIQQHPLFFPINFPVNVLGTKTQVVSSFQSLNKVYFPELPCHPNKTNGHIVQDLPPYKNA